jgi:hypothetical protein
LEATAGSRRLGWIGAQLNALALSGDHTPACRPDGRGGIVSGVSRPEGETDPVVDAYKPGVDRTLLVENLSRTPEERLRNLMALQRFAEELRRAGREATGTR